MLTDRTYTDKLSSDPEYASLLNSTPSLASSATGTVARKWLAMASQWCIDRHIDVVIESACHNIEEVMSLVSMFHVDRYRVHVAVMAVPECLSLLGNMVRYYKRRSEAQPGDQVPGLTPRSVHYQTYGTDSPSSEPYAARVNWKHLTDNVEDGLLTVADFVDKSSSVDDVIVVRRNSLVSYQNYRGQNGL